MWCIPPTEDARFVASMEDILEVYARPYDQRYPVVCVDEAAKQLLGEQQPALPARPAHEGRPGQVERPDHEYVRGGTCALFMVFEPLAAKRHVQVSAQRTCEDYARVIQWVCDELYPEALKIILVEDNLNTHGPHSLYKAFAPEEARRLRERIEWHYTPRHGSWLNMAELELSVLARQCLRERMENSDNLQRHVQAWQECRNRTATRVQWHFTTQDARRKLHRLYPKLLPG
jgi:hypothetical protein